MKKLLNVFLIIFSFCSLNAQNVTISGKVTDLSGNPISNQAVYINLPFTTPDVIIYTDNNGDYSFVEAVGNQQQAYFYLRVFDNCAGKLKHNYANFDLNTTGYLIENNNFSICNDQSNCSVSYTASQVNNGVNINTTTTGTPPFDISFNPYVPYSYTNTTNFTKFYDPTYSGMKNMSVQIEDANGCTASYTDSFNLVQSSTNTCYTDFDVIYKQPNSIRLNFNNSYSSNTNHSISIDYGDGTPATSAYYSNKTYTTPGTYNVCLTQSKNNCTYTHCEAVTITLPTTCDIELTTYVSSYYGYASFYTYRSIGAAPITYSYDYGDGTTGTSYSHSYSANGNYNACVTMTSATGCTNTTCTTILIDSMPNPNPPTCDISFNHTSTQGSANFSFNPTPLAGFQPVSYWWDFGDGTTSTLANPSHLYSSNGNYTICLSATDASGCTASYCDSIIVSSQNCSVTISGGLRPGTRIADFQAIGQTGVAPYSYFWDFGNGNTNSWNGVYSNQKYDVGTYNACVTITDANGCQSTDCMIIQRDSCTAITFSHQNLGSNSISFNPILGTGQVYPNTYAWDFGDGDTSTQANPTHTYANTGSYSACLTITDSSGCVGTFCDTLTLNGNACNLSVDFSGPPSNLGSYTKILNSTITGSNGAVSYYWDFGDGNTSTQTNPTHTYSDTGFYQICLAAIDASGCADSICYYTNVFDTLGNTSCNLDFSYQVNNTNGSVTFTSNVFGATNPISYSWDFGDGNTSTLANPTHTYTSSGNYLVTLSTVDANGCQGYYCVYVSVQVGGVGYNCNANFSYNYGANGLVYFNNISTGGIAPVNYAWSFGDGNTGFGINPVHNYTVSGWYQVCLGMTDATGCYSYDCDSVYVQAPQTCSVNFTWQLDSTGMVAFNSNPTGGSAPYSYAWDFGDGTTSTLANPTHNYTNLNNLTACLTVTDSAGCTASYCDTLSIYTGNCISTFAYQITGNDVAFTTSAFGTAPFSYIWYLGDGTVSTSANPNHTYAANGIYNVCLATLDATGCASTFCSQVVIQSNGGNLCESDFSYQTSGNGVVNFVSNVISGTPTFTYAWDFGDGTFASSANPSHTYANTGWYLPCLTVTDSTGCSSSYCDTLYVQSATTCSVDLSYFNINGSDTVNFNVATTGVAPFTYAWDFGDGSFSSYSSPNHVFNTTNQDSFYVCVTVIDGNGCTATDCDWIAAPDSCSAPATFNYQVQNNGVVNFYSTASMLGAPTPFLYDWDFGDGNTSTQDNPIYTYTTSGNYLVALTLTDSLTGCSSYYCIYVSVQVGGVGYTCNTSYSYLTLPNGQIYFNNNTTGIAPYTYSWNFDDGSTSSQANPSHSYSTTGYYSPCLTITDATGCTSTYCDTIYAQAQSSCFVNFSHQTYSYSGSTNVFFYPNLPGNYASHTYAWTFGNGNTSSSPYPNQIYTSSGYYQVCLTTVDSTNCTASFCDTIYVQVQTNSCNADFITVDSSGYTFFINQSSGTTGATTYSWDFGDGNTSTSYAPVHQYQNAGYYNACLTIIDNSGCTSTYCDSIYSYGMPNCDVTLTHYNDSIYTPTLVHYNAIASGVAPFTYTWSFGDGHTITTADSYKWRSYQFNDTTIYACVTVTDAIGCSSTDCNWVYIPDTTGNNCNVDFTYQTGVDGTVNFYANNTGGTGPFTFVWDMGDSTSHTLQNPSHTFPQSGDYWACVTVYDALGCSNTYCDSVSVPGFTSTNEIEELTNILLFPNPVRDLLNVEFSIERSMDIEITVMSSTGQVVRQEVDNYSNGEQQITIPTSDLPNGFYLLRLKNEENVITRRFIKH